MNRETADPDIKQLIGIKPYTLHYKCHGSLNCYYDNSSIREDYNNTASYMYRYNHRMYKHWLIYILLFIIILFIFIGSKK